MASAPKEVIDVLIAEALGEGRDGIAAVAHVINTRSRLDGLSPVEVVTAPGQFSGYRNPGSSVRKSMSDPKVRQEVESIWNDVVSGKIPNPHPNADFFHTEDVSPYWRSEYQPVGQTGRHLFYASRPDAPAGKQAPTPADPPSRTLTGGRDAYLQEQEARLAPYRYEYSAGTKRNLPVSDALADQLTKSVTAVYGPDYTVGVMSGAQGRGSAGQVGSRRHGTEVAADVWVYDPSGRRLTGNELVPLSQHWLASGVGSVGFPADGRALHLDLIGGNVKGAVPLGPKEGRLWYYGTPPQSLRSTLSASLSDKVRPNYAFDPEIVEKGLIPPAEVPSAVASALDVTAPLVPPVPAPPIDRAPREAPVPAMRQGLLDMLKEGPPMPESLPEPMPAAPVVASAPADRPEGLLSYLAGPSAPETTPSERPTTRSPLVNNPAATMVAADVGLTQRNPVTPVITPENDNMYSYWIPDVTPASIVGGVGSLTPNFFDNGAAVAGKPSPPAGQSQQAAAPSSSSLSAQQLAAIYQQGGPTRPPENQVGIANTGRPMLDNGDGTFSTERTVTVTDHRINGGRPTNVPTIWGGRQLPEDMAVNAAVASGQTFTAFPSIAAAVAAAEYHSANDIKPAPTSRVVTPAQMLIAGSGDPWGASDGPAVRPRPQQAPAPAPSGLGGTAPQQGLGNVADAGGKLIESATPGFYRIAGINGGAGSVAMPADARPNVTIPDMPPAERRPDQNHPLLMPKYQEFQDFFGIEPKADYPNPIRSIADMEATQRKPTLSQPLSPNQGTTFAGQERGPTFKTVMKEERIENPEYKVWQANQTALTSSVPLGERTFSTSRDSKDARLAGEAFAANNMPERWITRQVPTRVPVAQPATKPVAPAAPPVAVPAVVPVAGTPQAQPRGLFDMLAPTSGPLAAILGLAQRQPVQVAQGHVGGGSHAFAIGPNGISAVTLNSGGNSAFDAANHSGQNMDVYRANREAIGGPITQSSISAAQSSGKTLFRG
jgi:hypothetical protein